MVEIVHEKHSGDTHYAHARLVAESGSDWWQDIEELHIKQTPFSVKLARMNEQNAPVTFDLSSKEIDALIESRTSFLADIQARKEAEEQRIQAEIEQARRLVESVRNFERPWQLAYREEFNCWTLESVSENATQTLIHGMLPRNVLSSVQRYLLEKKLIEPDVVNSADPEFDPFLDGDDLP